MPYRTFDEKEINDIFSYHAPNEREREAYAEVNGAFVECVKHVLKYTPDGPGKTVAVRKMNEARNVFNSAIALRGEF